MQTPQNRIIIPNRYDVKVSILLNTATGQTELKIEQGKVAHVQLLGLLSEHMTALIRNMVSTRQNPILDGAGNVTPFGNNPTEEGTNHAS